MVGCCVLFVIMLAACIANNMRINITPSYPLGLYQQQQIQDPAACKGQLVLVCPDRGNPVIRKAVELKILPPGTDHSPWRHVPLMKMLVGTPGDKVTVTDQGISINDHRLKNSKIKFEVFELLIHPGYNHTLRSNEYWVMSNYNPNSLDSRYIGPVSGSQIKQRVKPIITIK